MMKRSTIWCSLFCWALTASIVKSMRFDLQSGKVKCISEDIKGNSMTVGKYIVVNPNEGYPLPDTHRLQVKVASPKGDIYHSMDNVESGNFAFSSAETGDYVACFRAIEHKPEITLSIEFDWKTGIHAKDWSKVAKKTQIDVMEIELKKLFDTVTSVHEEMFYLREREQAMQNLNLSTNSQMAQLGVLSLVVCISVAGLQFWYLKSYFARKKML